MSELYHFTCDHGRQGIGDGGLLFPAAMLRAKQEWPWTARLARMTDSPTAGGRLREGLGLTSHILRCDRSAHRYRVVVDDEKLVERWVDYAHRLRLPSLQRENIEAEPGAMPLRWWVSEAPVRVDYDPEPVGAVS